MSNLSMFLTFLSEVTTSVLNFTLATGFVIIVFFVTITELMKAFNPNIETTEQAIKHITTKIKEKHDEEEENEEEYNTIFDEYNTWLVFLLYPIIGVFSIIAILLPLFPIFTAGLLDLVIKYYISVLPYFAMFVALYMGGLMFSRILIWGARKTYELIIMTIIIVIEEKNHD